MKKGLVYGGNPEYDSYGLKIYALHHRDTARSAESSKGPGAGFSGLQPV
jgi:hypothetical protein